MNNMFEAPAKSFIRLVESGRRTIDQCPTPLVATVKELAPELFEEKKTTKKKK